MGLRADLKLIFQERCDVLLEVWKLHWMFYRYRAQIWRDEKDIVEKMKTDPQTAEDWRAGLTFDFDVYEHLQTKRLKRLAERYHMSMPVGDEYYYSPAFDDRNTLESLNSAGKAAFQQTLMAIRKERREAARFWIASAIGIIGALTGLVAVM